MFENADLPGSSSIRARTVSDTMSYMQITLRRDTHEVPEDFEVYLAECCRRRVLGAHFRRAVSVRP